MAELKRDQIRAVVIECLTIITDLPVNFESAGFDNLTSEMKHLFLAALKSKLNALPFNMRDGSTNHLAYYDIDLTPDSVGDWGTVGNCIDWIVDNQKVVYLNN